MVKVPKSWVNKKSPTNPDKKEQHLNNKSKHELEHRWEEHDWELQLKDYISNASQQIQE